MLEPISAGAMGAVFRAHDSEAGKDVALKHLTDTRHAARFDIEARLLSHLQPPARRARARPLRRADRPIHRHGPDRGRGPRQRAQEARQPGPAAERGARLRARRVRGAPVRARAADRPPRREAAEPDRQQRRHRAGRLRRGARARGGGDRAPSGSARLASWRRRCSPAAPCRRAATCSAWPPRVDADHRQAARLRRPHQALRRLPGASHRRWSGRSGPASR